jgi:phage-related minor tail protein
MKRYEKYGRKASQIVKRIGKYRRKVSWIAEIFGKYRRKLWNVMENMDEMWNDMENISGSLIGHGISVWEHLVFILHRKILYIGQ